MIGVAVHENDLDAASEFFELFKTPWERALSGQKYRVLLTTDESYNAYDAEAVLIYSSRRLDIDEKAGIASHIVSGPVTLRWNDVDLPIYKGLGAFDSRPQDGILTFGETPITYRLEIEGRVVWRIGYDLFNEIRFLLTEGQPVEHALSPTIEGHIEVLRHLLGLCQVSFLEIPPQPQGYDFICCLTHDIDFFGIRHHLFDRTLVGFLYRASLGTLVDLVRGRRSPEEAYQNWLAVLSMPLVFLRVLPDFWRPFEEYAKVEDTNSSTFFLVPFKGKAGIAADGTVNTWRATSYGIGDIQEHVKTADAAGSELAIHGLDAWRDTASGREELNQLESLTDQKLVGIRMHWLYFDSGSPERLEKAGFAYDSTYGYNEAVGYRAGTSQPFRPLGCSLFMELPMAIMDSALFSSGRMNLPTTMAMSLCRRIIAHARRQGGAVVINWHDRSLAPERLWGRFYRELLMEMRAEGRVWFAKAREAIAWFSWRRSIRFSRMDSSTDDMQIQITAPSRMGVGALVHIHRPGPSHIEPEVRKIGGDALVTIAL